MMPARDVAERAGNLIPGLIAVAFGSNWSYDSAPLDAGASLLYG